MEHKEISISKDLRENNAMKPDVHFKDEPLEYKEVIATSASVRARKHNDLKLIKTECDEFDIEVDEINIKEECEEDTLQVTFTEVACNSFCDDVKIECENIPVEDPLRLGEDYEDITSLKTRRLTKHQCKICNKQVVKLDRHMKIHTGEKPFKCDICEQGFIESTSLTRHRRIHTGEKPFKCETCEMHFTFASGLSSHRRVHTGERPYKCDICFKGFCDSSSLKRHRKMHTRQKRKKSYKCFLCKMQLSSSRSLKMHLSIHTGNKPFKCDICDKEYRFASNLTIHKKAHTSTKCCT